jgi:predicted DsbA family dithiol-disulfide isomerase
LLIKAAELSGGEDAATSLALTLRRAFFIDAVDISCLDILMELVKAQRIDHEAVWEAINCGSAIASVMNDYQCAKNQGIKGSPSYIIDGGRQILYGNVGFRVLHANINELLKKPEDEASWC